MTDDGYIRIGELSRRVGVSPELLRAWERRYGILAPGRSAGRFRLYTDADVARVRAMQANLAQGLSAAEAARRALDSPAEPLVLPGDGTLVAEATAELWRAVGAYDEPRAHAALDRLLAALGIELVLRDVLLPFLQELGLRWERGEVTVAHEHFASNLIRGRLLGLGRGWGRGSGPRAVLAAAPGEQHDLALLAFGLALRERGWTITFLGADTPVETLAETAERVAADIVVVSATTEEGLRGVVDDLAGLAAGRRVAIAGAGSSLALADRAGVEYLGTGPVEAAQKLAAASGSR